MTAQETIKKLADDQGITRAKAEDILLSIKDIVVGEIIARRTCVMPGLGRFAACNGGSRPVRFRFDEALYPTFNINSKVHVKSCTSCGERPPVPGRRKCRQCFTQEQAAYRRKRRGNSKFKIQN